MPNHVKLEEMSSDEMGEHIIPSSEESSTNKLLLVLICIIGVVSVVALALAAFSFSQNGTTTVNVGTTSETKGDDKIWTFSIGHGENKLEYIHGTTGTLRGFHVDIVNAVCAIAKKNCRLIWDIYPNCYASQAGERSRGGFGLMGRWYDGCTGWYNTYDRALTVDFTTPFRNAVPGGSFFVKDGNPDGFQWTDLTGKTIGFLDGWAHDEHCLARLGDQINGVPLEASQIVHYQNVGAGVAAVKNGEVSAIFTNKNHGNGGAKTLQMISDDIRCVKDGAGMMYRKDTLLADWWNPAFERLKGTTYRDICAKLDKEHGSQPGVDADVMCGG